MSNIILVIVTALISGLLATVVTIWWQRKNAVYNSKMEIFKTLMSYRYDITAEESVKAFANWAKEQIPTGNNHRAGAAYRTRLIGVLSQRLFCKIGEA